MFYIVVRSKPKVVIEPIEFYKSREEELARLKKKVFEFETLKALMEAKEGRGKIFKSAKTLLASLSQILILFLKSAFTSGSISLLPC